eukprot:gene25892-11565_t
MYESVPKQYSIMYEAVPQHYSIMYEAVPKQYSTMYEAVLKQYSTVYAVPKQYSVMYEAVPKQNSTMYEAVLKQYSTVYAVPKQYSVMLQKEQLPKLAFELGQLQDAFVLLGDYNMKIQQMERHLIHMSTFMDTLVGQRARHSLLDILRRDEIGKLQARFQPLSWHCRSNSCPPPMATWPYACPHPSTVSALLSSSMIQLNGHGLLDILNQDEIRKLQGLNEMVQGVEKLLSSVSEAAATRSAIYHALPPQHLSVGVPLMSPHRLPETSHNAADPYLDTLHGILSESPSEELATGSQSHRGGLALGMSDQHNGGMASDAMSMDSPLRAGHSSMGGATPGRRVKARAGEIIHGINRLDQSRSHAQEAVNTAVGPSGLPQSLAELAGLVEQVQGMLYPAPGSAEFGGAGAKGGGQGVERASAGGGVKNVGGMAPTMTHTELEAGLQQLQEMNSTLQASTNDLVKQYTDCTAEADQHKTDTLVERQVLRNFYLSPVQLEHIVGDLTARLEALTGPAEA